MILCVTLNLLEIIVPFFKSESLTSFVIILVFTLNMINHYLTYRTYIKKRFRKPVLKIPINGGLSCPNRDSTKSSLGCSFCDNRSFSPVSLESSSVISQLTASIRRASSRYELFIAYLQPFSNTYGTVEKLKSIYEPLIAVSGVIGLAVGTRPDCLSSHICDYLADINKRTYLSVELGLQSASEKTLAYNNRGHTFSDFKVAVMGLADREVETVAHVMIGLPGDTAGSILDTARELAQLPVSGVKIHQLMIIHGTKIEEWYNKGEIKPLELHEYAELVGNFISLLRPDQYIHRVMADSKPEHGLIAPLWSAEKMRSIAFIQKYMDENSVIQGRGYKG